jgi:hypothetical protein
MQLRRIIKDEELMKEIGERLIKKGRFKVGAEVRVKNMITAQLQLKEAGIL